jgi:hypothetical protein
MHASKDWYDEKSEKILTFGGDLNKALLLLLCYWAGWYIVTLMGRSTMLLGVLYWADAVQVANQLISVEPKAWMEKKRWTPQ